VSFYARPGKTNTVLLFCEENMVIASMLLMIISVMYISAVWDHEYSTDMMFLSPDNFVMLSKIIAKLCKLLWLIYQVQQNKVAP